MDNLNDKKQKLEKKSVFKRTGEILQVSASWAILYPVRNRYVRLYQERTSALVSDLLIIIGIMLMFVALIFFWNHPLTSNSYIDLQLNATGEQVSGDLVGYKLTWQNNNRNLVEGAYFSLLLPVGLELKNVDSGGFEYDEDNNLVRLGDLLPGAGGEINIWGNLWIDIDQGVDWEVKLYYHNLGILHNKTLQQNFSYNQSLLTSDISIPAKVYAANNFSIQIKLINNSKQTIPIVSLKLYSPETFTLVGWPFGLDNYTWQERQLLSGEIRTIDLVGKVNKLTTSTADLALETSLARGKEFLKQDWQVAESLFILPKIDLNLDLPSTISYHLGQEYEAQIYYYNREDYDLSQVQICPQVISEGLRINFQPTCYSFPTIESQSENWQPVRFSIQKNDYNINRQIKIWTELSWLEQVENNQSITRYVFSPEQKLVVDPDLNILTKIYYYTPGRDQIGYGPLPPTVDEATSYWVSIRLWPSFGKVEGLSLEAFLGDNVKLLDYNSSLGTIAISDKIVWLVGDYNTAILYQPEPRLNLQIEVNPSQEQLGKQILLLQNIDASAQSDITDSQILVSQSAVINDMSSDMFWPNDGRVQN